MASETRSPLQRLRAILLTGWVRAWMTIRRIRVLEMGAWWLSDRLYNLALLIREGSELLTLHRLDDPVIDQAMRRQVGRGSGHGGHGYR